MAKKSTIEKAKNKVAGAAQTGADAVRDIAGEAIRAAAVAAAGVALQRTAEALRGGARTAEAAAPRPKPKGRPAKSTRRTRRTPAKKARRKPAKAAKRRSAKKKPASRRRSSR